MLRSWSMRIEIICTGDEVLTGATINTNFSHISQKLGDVGLQVLWGTTVGDDRETLLQAFRLAGDRADAVIVNGGLGPTVDDLSQEVAAQAAGRRTRLQCRSGSPRWRNCSVGAAASCRLATASRRCCPRVRNCSTIRLGLRAVLRSTSARHASFSRQGCLGNCIACSRSRSSLDFSRGADSASPAYSSASIRMGSANRVRILCLQGLSRSRLKEAVKLGFRAHFPQLETKLTVRGTRHGGCTAQSRPGRAGSSQAVG